MADCIKILNDLPSETRELAVQMLKFNNEHAAEESNEELLHAAMSYTYSACYYADKTPLEANAESRAGRNQAPQNLTAMGIPEFTTDGTNLTHLNKAKLSTSLYNVLKIELLSISNVVDRDHSGGAMQNRGSDPFVVFTAGISMSCSEMKTNKSNVEWKKTHYLLVRNDSLFNEGVPRLDIHVIDRDSKKINQESSLYEMLKHGDLLASTSYDITNLPPTNDDEPLKIMFDTKSKKTDDRMKLYLELKLISLDDYCDDLGVDTEQWFDSHPLRTNVQGAIEKAENTEFRDLLIYPMLHFHNKHTNTQGWIHAHNDKDHTAIVAFSGANIKDKQDYLNDKDSHFASLEGMDIDDYVLQRTDALANHKGKKVHCGFRDAYNSVRESLLQNIYSRTGWNANWQVVFTGESLGGALATLGAYEFANRKLAGGNKVNVVMMNYGSPRIANPEFVASYAESVPVSYRFRSDRHRLCCYPRNMNHVSTLVTWRPNKEVVFCFPGPEKLQNARGGRTSDEEDKEDAVCAAKSTVHEAVAAQIDYDFSFSSTVRVSFN